MSAKTIKGALGLLQDDPDNGPAWAELRTELGTEPGMSPSELEKLLEAARRAHEGRREYEAVAKVLEIEASIASGGREIDLLAELARVLDEDLLDDVAARAAYEKLLAARPNDAHAAEALERSDARRAKWHELVDRYVQEAQGAADTAFRSSLLVSAAEVTYRYGRQGANGDVERLLGLLREGLELDPKNRRGEILIERVLREGQRWDDLALVLERFASEATQKEEKIAGWVRLARAFAKKLKSPERAAAAYERVIDVAPGHQEATNFLADYFTSQEMWEHLVALYEGQLTAGALRSKEEEFGAVLQV